MSTPPSVSPEALERFHEPRNFGPLEPWDGHARITGPCGDTMEFWLRIADRHIVQASFITDGCGPSRAAGSMATELATGRLVTEALQLEPSDVLRALHGLPPESEHCALLAVTTLKAAIADGQQRPRAAGNCGGCSAADSTAKSPTPDGAQRDLRDREALARRMGRIGHKLLVMSGKGGVGKSTVSTSLAVALALAGKQVGLLDVDIHGPSIPTLLGLQNAQVTTRNGELLPLEVGENLKVVSMGFFLSSDRDAVIWRGPMKYTAIKQFLKDVAWGQLDYLVVDAPPGTGDEPLSVAQLIGQPAAALLVTTPQDLSVADVRRSVSFCETVSMPVAGIIENMSGLECPHCGRSIDLFQVGGGESLAREMGVPFLGRIPLDPEIVICGDRGLAYLQRYADRPAALALAQVVQRLVRLLETAPAASIPTLTSAAGEHL